MNLFKVIYGFVDGSLLRVPEIEVLMKEPGSYTSEYTLNFKSVDTIKNEIYFNMRIPGDSQNHSRIYYWDRRASDEDFLKRVKVSGVKVLNSITGKKIQISGMDRD